jgi:hypothetical protein
VGGPNGESIFYRHNHGRGSFFTLGCAHARTKCVNLPVVKTHIRDKVVASVRISAGWRWSNRPLGGESVTIVNVFYWWSPSGVLARRSESVL